MKVFALDAAQPFDFEHKMQNKVSKDKQLTIGIVGFGTFGQFLARRMVEAGHRCVGLTLIVPCSAGIDTLKQQAGASSDRHCSGRRPAVGAQISMCCSVKTATHAEVVLSLESQFDPVGQALKDYNHCVLHLCFFDSSA